jgi:hypothetical protein
MDQSAIPEPFPGHETGVWSPVNASIVASWPAPAFAENLVVDPDGAVPMQFS